MATLCPKCKTGTLKKGEKMVYCGDYKPKKSETGVWTNEGTCDFHINLTNKIWGAISPEDIKSLVEGKTLTNKKGDKMTLDLTNDFFTKIEKVEDADL